MHKIILIILLPILAWGQRYLWPTNASDYLTSSFCEYRSGHFHAGIDIKTWNTEGYPCYAVDNGRIIKIRVSPFGYGKALYLKLKDGRVAVYGHLQRFSKSLEKKVRAKQIKNKRYSLVWNPRNLKVKRGEIIAFSGQTGIGVPHLHFEIRDRKERPLNPLRFYKNKIKDQAAPKLLELLIIPQNEDSRVNGSFLPKAFPLKLMNNNIYIIKGPLFVKGRVGLALRGFDRADGVHNKFSCYRQTLSADDKKIFQAQYDKLDFATTGQIDIAIHYPAKAKTGKVFTKLFIEPYNTLPFFDRSLGSGLIEVRDESVPFTIEARDFYGNMSNVTGILQADLLHPAEMLIIRQMNDLVFLNAILPLHLDQLQFFTQSCDGKNKTIEYFEVLEREYFKDRQRLLVKLKLKQSQIKAIGCRFSMQGGRDARLITQTISDSVDLPEFQIINNGKFIAFFGSNIPAGAKAEISSNKENFILTLNNHDLHSVLTAQQVAGDTIHFRVFDGQKILADSALYFHALFPDQEQFFTFHEENCLIQSGRKTVYDTLLFNTKRLPRENISFPQTSNGKPTSYFIQSDMYRLDSAPQALRKSMQLSLKYDSLFSSPKQLGIYKLNKKKRFRFLGNKRDSVNFYISAKIRSGGDFFVLADTVAPQVDILYPRNGGQLKTLNKIEFRAEDNLSGIGSEKNLAIDIDGEFVIPEWDPERKRITGRPHWRINPGRHTINISVTDQAGNKTQKKLEINIKE